MITKLAELLVRKCSGDKIVDNYRCVSTECTGSSFFVAYFEKVFQDTVSGNHYLVDYGEDSLAYPAERIKVIKVYEVVPVTKIIEVTEYVKVQRKVKK